MVCCIQVKRLEDYKWLNSPGIRPTYDVPDGNGIKDDAEELVGVRDALSNFMPDNADNVFACTMAVLRMGDIEIGGSDNSSVEDTDEALLDVAMLYQVEEQALKEAITCATLVIQNKPKKLSVSSVTAGKYNASIAKSVYNLQFEWMVAQCSKDLVKDVPMRNDGDSPALISAYSIDGSVGQVHTQFLSSVCSISSVSSS